MDKNIYNTDKELLRLATAGSVDDGKSTLIGRLFYDTENMYTDHFEAIKSESKKRGLKEVDLSLFTDGLSAEREQGITIDVAYRYFDTQEKRIIIADVPGHEQYTRNMITGISSADVVLILVDVKNGLTTQSKRHLFIASLLETPHIVVIINKMDLVGYKKDAFEKIKDDFLNYASKLKIKDLQFIPTSSLKGDMIAKRGDNMDWYGGDTLLYYLENIPKAGSRNLIDFRFPVQLVLRADGDFRGYGGKIEGGTIKVGENVLILPSSKKAKINEIFVSGKKRDYAFNPQSAVLGLDRELDVSRGDVIVRENNLPTVDNILETSLCWFSEEKLDLKKNYLIKHTSKICRCHISDLKYEINVETLHREKANTLKFNEIGRATIRVNEQLMFDAYLKNKNTGSFVIIDEITKNTVGAGIIIDKGRKREEDKAKRQVAPVLWFTGLSGSGKSTIAKKISEKLEDRGFDYHILDGDVMRRAFGNDLGFSKEDREKNISRAVFLSNLLSSHGVWILAAFISPYKKLRKMVREKVNNFIEIFVDASLETCEKRDVKGLYKKVRAGEIESFTGISDSYEAPDNPEIILKTDQASIEECVDKVVKYLEDKNLI